MPQPLARTSSPPSCTCLATNPAVGSPAPPSHCLHTDRDRGPLGEEGVQVVQGFPITFGILLGQPFNRKIIVSGFGSFYMSVCSPPPEKPIMRMLDARTGDKEAQEFVRRLKEIEKSMEEE